MYYRLAVSFKTNSKFDYIQLHASDREIRIFQNIQAKTYKIYVRII